MDAQITNPSQKFILKGDLGGRPFRQALRAGRLLIGRSESCDIVIPDGHVSTIHAVLEVDRLGKNHKIYDMNSTNGTKLNGDQVVVGKLKAGDTISLGPIVLSFEEFIPQEVPPVLDMLSPAIPVPPAPQERKSLPSAPKIKKWKPLPKKSQELPAAPVFHEVAGEVAPRIVYPLAADPKADFSEYIFEDLDTLYPIFKYDIDRFAAEVIILHQDKIVSVDYVPLKDGIVTLKGYGAKNSEIEFAHLAKTESLAFLDIKGDSIGVTTPPGYKALKIGDEEETTTGHVYLTGDDILRLSYADLQIYVRRTQKPPQISSPPILRRDPEFKRYLFLVMLIVAIFLGGVSYFEVDKEAEKEKRPERIATILHRRKLLINEAKSIAKTQDAPKKIQKSPVQKERPKEQPKKPTQNVAQEKPKESKPKATSGTKSPVEKRARSEKKLTAANKATKEPPKAQTKATSAQKPGSTQRSRFSPVDKKSPGKVSAYKSPNFASTINSLLAKGGSTKGTKAAVAAADSGVGDSSAITGGDTSQGLTRSKVSSNVNLSNLAKGLDQSKGAEGLVDKKGVYTVGMPSKTVVLGSINPDDIKRILREHIPQFQYCYQSALDKSSKQFSGIVGLSFSIGASGHVTQSGVSQDTSILPEVKKCVLSVLNGIRFPEPLGGGSVSVKQSINFYPVVK